MHTLFHKCYIVPHIYYILYERKESTFGYYRIGIRTQATAGTAENLKKGKVVKMSA